MYVLVPPSALSVHHLVVARVWNMSESIAAILNRSI
jgi:hypothetical protein